MPQQRRGLTGQTLPIFPGEEFSVFDFPERVRHYPQLRYMGSKSRLLPWIHDVLSGLHFDSVLDAFAGSGCVAYLFKSMGKRVTANDFLNFARHIAVAGIQNSRVRLTPTQCETLMQDRPDRERFIEKTFGGIFFNLEDLRLLDTVWANLHSLPSRIHQSLALAALVRACVKRQPRGVFTVAGGAAQYDDGRRDLRLTLREQFLECVEAYNAIVFDNGQPCAALREDVLQGSFPKVDLVYMDPPYVPRSDDNCYIKRYHFLEGLASYWRESDTVVNPLTKVHKIAKRYTPFSYRRTALYAFDAMFRRFNDSILVLSYSSNGFPDLQALTDLMSKHKQSVAVYDRMHRYHFGTHHGVSSDRAIVREYLIVGQ